MELRSSVILALPLVLPGCNTDDDPIQVQAAFSATPVSGTAPLIVQFSDESIGDVGGWEWDLGDGTLLPVHSPSHTYTEPGTYTVTLHVISCRSAVDCAHSWEVKTDLITVLPATTAVVLTTPTLVLQSHAIAR
jgi:PKD repeat protein